MVLKSSYCNLSMKKNTTNQNQKNKKSVPKSEGTTLDFASSIIDNTSDAVIAIKLNGEITLWNNGAVACYGYTSGEALGKNISMVYRKEDLPLLGERIKKVIQGENISNAEVTIIDKSKNERLVLLSINGIKDEKGKVTEIVGFTKDITEQKLAEQTIKESEQKFSQAFDNSPIPIFILNLKTGKRLEVNNAFSATFGYSKEDLINEENIHKSNLAVNQDEFKLSVKKILKEGAVFQHPFSMYTKSGEIRHVLLNATKAYANNNDVFIISFLDTTSRNQTEDALKASEEKYRTIFEQSLVGIGMAKGNELVFGNKAMMEIFKYNSLEELLKTPLTDLIAPEYRELIKNRIKEGLSNKGKDLPSEYQYDILCRDGEIKTVIGHSSYIQIDGEIYAQTIVTDITDRIKAEEELRKSNLLLEASQEIAKVGGWELDVSSGNLFWTAETYLIHETSPEEFNPTVDAGVSYFLPESRKIISEALKLAMEKGQGYDLELETFTAKGNIINVRTTCEVTMHEGKPAKLTGIFLDITKQKQEKIELIKAKEQAEISELYLDNIINNIGDPVFVKDKQSRLLLINDAFCELFGVKREQAIGKTMAEDVSPKERDIFLKIDKQVIKTGKESIVEETLTIKGELTKTISTRKSRYIDSNKKKYIIGVIRDITHRKIAEEKIKESKSKFEILTNVTFEGILIHDKGVPVDMNIAFPKMFGYTKDEFVDKDLVKLIIAKEYHKTVAENIINEYEQSYEAKGIKKDGTEFPLEIEGRTYISKEKKKYRVTAIRDISDRKNAEKELNKAQEIARVGSWYIDILTGEMVWSEELYKMYGFDPKRPLPPLSEHEKYLAPESWERLSSCIENTIRTGKPYSVELKGAEGVGNNWKWMFGRGEAVFDSENKIIGVRGTGQDITAQKEAEENLQQKDHIIESASSAIATSDLDGNMTYGNPAFKKLWRFDHDEDYLNKPFTNYWLLKENEESVNTSLTDKGYWKGELKAKRKDGSEFDVRVSAAMVNDGDGNPVGLMSSSVDITESKLAEENLKESKEQLVSAQKRAKLGNWSWDLITDKIIWSDEMYTIYGLPKNTTLTFDTIVERTHPDELENYKIEIALWIEKEIVSPLEYRIIKPNKEIIHVSALVDFERNENGDLVKLTGTVQDITDRKIAEQKVIESEISISAILNSLPSSVCVIDDTGKILQVNDAWKEFGESGGNQKAPELYTEYNYFDICRTDHQDENAKAILEGLMKILKGDIDRFEYEYPCHSPNKKQWFIMRADLMKTEDRQVVISHIDITSRKLAEENLKEIHSQLNMAVDSAKLGVWSLDINTGGLVWNNELFEIYGIAPSEFDYAQDSFEKLVHPEDLEYVMSRQAEIFQNKSISELEFRIIRPNKEVRYINASATPVIIDGKLEKIIGINEDITERKTKEKELKSALGQLNELKLEVEAENIYLKEELKLEGNFQEIIGSNKSLTKVLKQVEQVAKTDATVLILGETGTGKELIARAIHKASNRRDKPLVKVNCAALPAELIESELFGHEKGSFTGAINRKIGRFELAHKGTIFLDEIGDLPIGMQTRLLRVLQEQEFERVGGEITIKVDVRVIAATNRNLEKRVESGEFRQDLYYRLNVFPIISPSLKERLDDIPELVHHFINKYNAQFQSKVKTVHQSVFDSFLSYDWPGNIRELEHIIQRAIILNTGTQLRLGKWFVSKNSNTVASEKMATLEVNEKVHILKVLKLTNWKVRGENGASEILGIKPTTLESRMKKLDIKKH